VAILAVAAVLKAAGKLGDFPPSVFGKLSTLVQLLTAGAVLLRWPADPAPFYYATILLAVVSAAHYGYQIRQKLN
jgi:phosphatidylglycerophosphate synthase